jgi:hypothetical protein
VFLRTTNRTEGYISITQKDHRYFTKNYEYSLARLILLKIDKVTNTLSKYIADLIDCDRDGTIKVELDPGDYYLIIEMDWKSAFSRDLTISYYGQHPVNFIEDHDNLEIEHLFNEVVLLH